MLGTSIALPVNGSKEVVANVSEDGISCVLDEVSLVLRWCRRPLGQFILMLENVYLSKQALQPIVQIDLLHSRPLPAASAGLFLQSADVPPMLNMMNFFQS